MPFIPVLESSPQSTQSDEAELLQAGYRFALSLTHHREEAEDLIQETWLNLCRRYGRVESRAVLFTSLRNLYIDQCRRRKIVWFESLDQPEISEVAEEPAEEPCLKGEISGLLGALRPAEREVVFLHYYEGHTAEEIGLMTEQPRGTVLSLLHRSIAKLRKAAESMPGAFPRNQLLLFFVVLAAAARFLKS
jgi:RNA polymerase sigma-70 factor (ECF subfamily)